MVCLYASSSLRARAPLRGTNAKLEDVAAAHFVGLPVVETVEIVGLVNVLTREVGRVGSRHQFFGRDVIDMHFEFAAPAEQGIVAEGTCTVLLGTEG